MAGTALSNALDSSELEQIPTSARNKIEELLNVKIEEANNLKSKYEKLRVNSEQQYFDIEKQLITSNGKLETITSQKNSLQEKFEELEAKHTETSKKLQELQESRESFQTSEHEYKSTIQILENEKRDLNIIANKRSKEIDRLNEEIEEVGKKLTKAINEKCEAQARLSELQSEEVSREYREKRLESEKEQLEKQVEWYNQQLTEKTNQLSSVRKEKTSHVLEIQSQLEEKTQELTHLQAVINSMKESAEEQGKRLDSLNQKLKDERDNQVQLEEQFRQELAVQKRLIDLYKVSAKENDEKVAELTSAVDELRKLLKDASAAYTQLETTKTEEITKLEAACKEKDEAVSKLTDELKNANDLMTALKKGAITLTEEAVESLSPAAAATSKLLKSGMTLTQIYSEYVQATDALNCEREENKRLNSYLEQILQEIEEKAPLLKKQREDYETALTSLDQMTSQLDTAMLECEKLRADADDMRRRYGHMQRECSKYQQSAQDLGRQVRTLLKEVEELRGGRVVRDDHDVSSSEVSSSSSIITEKLVTVRSIEEMQQQNQRLIEVCRELSEKKEQGEMEATNEKTRELKEQLDFALSELEHLKDARARQAEMVESIVRQRDMYRVLLQQGGSPAEVAAFAPVTSTPAPAPAAKATTPGQDKTLAAAKKELEDTKNALTEMQAEFDAYKKDKAENEKLQNETLEKVRQNLSDLRVANTKLSTQLEFATERYKIIQNNAAGYKKEIDLLQERNHQSAATILRHESAIAHLKEELMGAQENVARWQVQVDNLKAERELIKNAERRLRMELESVRREQTSQSMLMANLQAIQNNQERAEFENRTRHTHQVEGLEREIATLRRRLENSLEEKTKQATAWEDIVKTVHLELQHEKDKQAALQTKADNAAAELETVKQELSTCEAKLAAAEQKLENLSNQANKDDDSAAVESRVETEAVKDLKNRLAQQQGLIKNLREQLEGSKKHAAQYKTIADSVEQKLKDEAKTSKEVQEACEKKIQEAHAEKDAMAIRLEMIEKELEEARAENSRLSTESSSLHDDLRKQLTTLRTELEEALSQKETAITNSEAAQQDCKKQAEIASQAQDKYQRELMLHAADVEALAAVRKQLEDIQEHLQQSQEETVIYEKQLTDAKTSWAEQERVYKEEQKMVEARCDELTKQNTALHEQMTKLSSQVLHIQQSSRRDSGVSFSATEEGKTSDQLLEVIRFLRREKEIAETKLQVVETECTRVKQRLAHIEKQAEEANKSLAEERQRAQVNAETVANQVELMRKVSNLNVLTDSNKLLRDERDQLLNSKQELESKVRKLESDIEPLQNSMRELESEKESLTVERKTLQEEVNRWKDRASKLIEQSNKTDPEEHKRLTQEKENIRKQLGQAREENVKQKAELNRLNSVNTNLQTEVNNLKQENTKTSQERDILKKQTEAKTKDVEEKNNTISRLKLIGRKYKEQAEKITKELEDVKVKAAGQESDKVNVATLEQTIAELRRTITGNSANISSLEAQLTESQNEAQAAIKRAEQAQVETNSLRETVATKEQELAEVQENNRKLRAEVDDFEKRSAEFEKKLAQSRQVLQNARNKMMTQKSQMEKLDAENKELKDAMAVAQSSSGSESDQTKALKAQYDARIASLERELRELRGSTSAQATSDAQLDRMQMENMELNTKVQQLQRQLEAAQHKPGPPQQPVAARPASTVGPSTTSSDAPKTANIKPMATTVSTSRQTVPITSHSPAAVKATASIRPMAISPTTTSQTSTGTPTATVMPTTVSQHDSSEDNLPGPSGLQQSSSGQSTIPAASVSGRVQIVEPQVVMEWNPDNSGPSEQAEESSTNQAVVTPSIQETVTQVVNPTIATPSTSGASASGAAESVPAQPQQHTTGVALGKRAREDETFQSEEMDQKRARLANQDHPIPTITVIDENQQVVTQIQPQQATSLPQSQQQQQQQQPISQVKPAVSLSQQVSAAVVAPATSQSAASTSSTGRQTETAKDGGESAGQSQQEEASSSMKTEETQQANDDVIMVLSDEDDQGDEDQGDEDDDEEEDYEDDDDDEDDEDEDIEETEDGDDVVIIDMDESQSQSQSQDTQSQGTSRTSAPRPPPALQPIAHAERLPSVGRTQQLTPFLIGAQGNIFEEDDCTVPSTPTLSQPRRGDGFAEALNSPAVSQRFVFGTEGGSNPELAQLESQRALGMDDTRMDLSQFDETGARSVPTTPTPQGTATETRTEATAEENLASTLEGTAGEEDTDQTQDPVSRTEGDEEGGEEEDDLLEGEGEHEEDVEEAEGEVEEHTDPQASGDGSNRPGTSRDDPETSQDRTEGGAKPQIKKIVWDSPESSSSTTPSGASAISVVVGNTASIPTLQQPQRQPVRRAQGLRRGGPSRGRGGQYWAQTGQPRGGSQYSGYRGRGGRGGFRS